MEAHTYSSIQEAEAGKLGAQGQPDYTARPHFKKTQKTKTKNNTSFFSLFQSPRVLRLQAFTIIENMIYSYSVYFCLLIQQYFDPFLNYVLYI